MHKTFTQQITDGLDACRIYMAAFKAINETIYRHDLIMQRLMHRNKGNIGPLLPGYYRIYSIERSWIGAIVRLSY